MQQAADVGGPEKEIAVHSKGHKVHVGIGQLAPHEGEDCVGTLGDDADILEHARQYLMRGQHVP